ncbi:hypothetical protein ACFB49_31520 [Sphingomonas sp. DBB INV C78]|uniref:TraB/GumN family protein n=1 Tax=Sphingomonas sp. DBB INV C78 TaxID=3349434 RepID=UPI0036D3469D
MSMYRKLLSTFVAVGLAACSPANSPPAAAPAPREAHPALWKLSDADTTIWLFGTIHVLPAGYKWRHTTIDKAVAESDGLVIEAILDRKEPAKAFALLNKLGVSPGLPPLVERVPQDKRAALTALMEKSTLPKPFLDSLETWAGGLMLMPVLLGDLGLKGGKGVEEVLEEDFKAAGKPIEGLETAELQLRVLDGMSEDAQRQFLVAMVDDKDEKLDFNKMLAAWARGDEKAISKSFDKDIRISPELREALLVQRNARWADWLQARLNKPGTIFVAVGAGHLAGEESVLRMLKAKGLKVERVE